MPFDAVIDRARNASATLGLLPGIALVAALSAAAVAIAERSHIPAVLLAVLLGIGLAPIRLPDPTSVGIQFCARPLLRFGIALMGVRLSFHEITALGLPAIVIAMSAVAVALIGGTAIGRLFGLSRERAILSAGAVGICGASAALAISSALPASSKREGETIQTIALVTGLSTIVMFLYPLIARRLGLDDIASGVAFGASIHDMTQVLGAGEMISPVAATAATATKLVRIACLAPAVAVIGLALRANATRSPTARGPLLPRFLVGFVLLALATNAGLIPPDLANALSRLATIILIAASGALGLKTSLGTLRAGGWQPVAAMIAQTLLIGGYALAAVMLSGF